MRDCLSTNCSSFTTDEDELEDEDDVFEEGGETTQPPSAENTAGETDTDAPASATLEAVHEREYKHEL